MEKYEKAIDDFINKMDYSSNEDVLGIVFCGSYLTGCNHSKSDIDLFIVMRDELDVITRGASIYNGFKIEYFERPLHDLYEQADKDFLVQKNALLSIIGYGKILLDKTGAVKKLQEYILKKYEEPLHPLTMNDAKESIIRLTNIISMLQTNLDNNSPWFNHNYHKVIERMRALYSKMLGCSDDSDYRVEKLYFDEKYRQAFRCYKIPDEKFIKMYYDAGICDGNNKEKMAHVNAIYDYITKNVDLDTSNYRITIKSRNDPTNKVHDKVQD